MNKRVTFAPQYSISKWSPSIKQEIEKTFREVIDMRSKQGIEEELVTKHEKDYVKKDFYDKKECNKRELCSQRIANRDMVVRGGNNPFMVQNNYLDDLTNQDKFLRPQDSNYKKKEE